MPNIIVEENFQITLPQEIVSQLHLTNGDILNVEVLEGKIVMHVKNDESGFYTPESQEKFLRALQDVETRNTHPVEDHEDLMRQLYS